MSEQTLNDLMSLLLPRNFRDYKKDDPLCVLECHFHLFSSLVASIGLGLPLRFHTVIDKDDSEYLRDTIFAHFLSYVAEIFETKNKLLETWVESTLHYPFPDFTSSTDDI